jgi:hypothetical protein
MMVKLMKNFEPDGDQIKPDYGEFSLKFFGETPTKLFLARESSVFFQVGRTSYISFSTGTHVGTIEMPELHKQQAEAAYQKSLTSGLMVQVKPSLRYWTEKTQEWVLPFYIAESLPLPSSAQSQLSKAEKKRQRRAAKRLSSQEPIAKFTEGRATKQFDARM